MLINVLSALRLLQLVSLKHLVIYCPHTTFSIICRLYQVCIIILISGSCTLNHIQELCFFFLYRFEDVQVFFLLLKTTEGSFQRGVCINITNRCVFFKIQVSQFGLVDLDCYLDRSVSMFVTLKDIFPVTLRWLGKLLGSIGMSSTNISDILDENRRKDWTSQRWLKTWR